jgi:hypothetical protein
MDADFRLTDSDVAGWTSYSAEGDTSDFTSGFD